MKKICLIAGIAIVIFASTFYVMAQNTKKNSLTMPEKIIIYTLGKRIEIQKSDPMFDKIFKEVKESIEGRKLTVDRNLELPDEVDAKTVRTADELNKAIELYFGDYQTLKVSDDKIKQIKFKNIYLELNMWKKIGGVTEQAKPHFKYGDGDKYSNNEIFNLGDPTNLMNEVNKY